MNCSPALREVGLQLFYTVCVFPDKMNQNAVYFASRRLLYTIVNYCIISK